MIVNLVHLRSVVISEGIIEYRPLRSSLDRLALLDVQVRDPVNKLRLTHRFRRIIWWRLVVDLLSDLGFSTDLRLFLLPSNTAFITTPEVDLRPSPTALASAVSAPRSTFLVQASRHRGRT
jgi:hypothetical protein